MKKVKPKAMGSDRGLKAKANVAEKKSQVKTASKLKIPKQRYSSMGDELMSSRAYNSRVGDLAGGYFMSGPGRTSQRGADQAKRAKAKKKSM